MSASFCQLRCRHPDGVASRRAWRHWWQVRAAPRQWFEPATMFKQKLGTVRADRVAAAVAIVIELLIDQATEKRAFPAAFGQ